MDAILMAKLLGLVEPVSTQVPQLLSVHRALLEPPGEGHVRWIVTAIPQELQISCEDCATNITLLVLSGFLAKPLAPVENSLHSLLLGFLQAGVPLQHRQDGLLLLLREEAQVDHGRLAVLELRAAATGHLVTAHHACPSNLP